MSKVTVIRALARLEQKGMTQARWIKDGGWKRRYYVSDRRVEELVKKKLEPLFAISVMDLQE
jgi:DNA-binding PadR family transcriptional regulator